MRNATTVSKWGNSLAVRIPQAIAKGASLNEGDCAALAIASDGAIVPRPTRRRYELSALVSRIAPTNRHKETDWGNPQGGESWCWKIQSFRQLPHELGRHRHRFCWHGRSGARLTKSIAFKPGRGSMK
jgi:antitoxin MazE